MYPVVISFRTFIHLFIAKRPLSGLIGIAVWASSMIAEGPVPVRVLQYNTTSTVVQILLRTVLGWHHIQYAYKYRYNLKWRYTWNDMILPGTRSTPVQLYVIQYNEYTCQRIGDLERDWSHPCYWQEPNPFVILAWRNENRWYCSLTGYRLVTPVGWSRWRPRK